jgi:hypothetical protein
VKRVLSLLAVVAMAAACAPPGMSGPARPVLAETTVPETTVPTTVPETTVPETTVPEVAAEEPIDEEAAPEEEPVPEGEPVPEDEVAAPEVEAPSTTVPEGWVAMDDGTTIDERGWTSNGFCVTGAPCESDPAFAGPSNSTYNWETGTAQW